MALDLTFLTLFSSIIVTLDLIVASSVNKNPFYSLSVDESLNDIGIKNNCVSTRYLTSGFLASVVDLLETVITCISESNLALKELVQLSTDGSNVNLN